MFPLEIEDLDDDGRGIGRHDGAAVHVTGALPGDRALVELEHRSPHRAQAWARLVAIERASPARVPGCCPATGHCGGCPLGALAYAEQLANKGARLARSLAALGVRPLPMVASPRPLGYRGVAKLVFGLAPGAPAPCLGGYAPRSHELVDLAGCTVVEPAIEAARARVLEVLLAERTVPYDERSARGVLAYVVVRANHLGQRLATLVGPDLDALTTLGRAVHARAGVEGVAANRRGRGNAIFGDETRAVAGLPELEERVGEVSLRISPTAFFQVNRQVAHRIYADLAATLAPSVAGPVVDLFSGVGGIALTLARKGVPAVTGVEANPAAVRDAERAAAAQGLPVRFLATEAAMGLRAIDGPVDTIVVNPPRRGLDEATLAAIVAARPRQLAYVSCDPSSLVRDLIALGRAGLGLLEARGYDMHPQTPHIETLAICRRV